MGRGGGGGRGWGGGGVGVCFFFFFKQKTAYEIVSRDWSSDVCSSDLVALLYKELKLLSFDPDFGASLGFPMRRIEVLLTFLLVVVVVVGLQTVGVILIVATLVTRPPPAASWPNAWGPCSPSPRSSAAALGPVARCSRRRSPGCPPVR